MKTEVVDFSKLRALIVDDNPGMLSSMRSTMSAFGVVLSNTARNAADAIYRIRNVRYDLIVCDFFLGDGTNGQQLLEYLRQENLLPRAATFIMVSAERSYERVVSAAELAPDDYLIKPFSAEAMRLRLMKVLEKKRSLMPIFSAIDGGDRTTAIARASEMIAARSRYLIDLLRLRGELLLAEKRLAEAGENYASVIAIRPVPWARLGLARVRLAEARPAEARTLLAELVADTPDYLAAYDLLARVHEEQGEVEDAKAVLRMAIEVSPGTLHRQKSLGTIAYRSGDLETAEKALATVVQKSRHAVTRTADDHLALSRVKMDLGKYPEALETLLETRQTFSADGTIGARSLALQSLVHKAAGDHRASVEALNAAIAATSAEGVAMPPEVRIDIARSCLLNERDEEAGRVLRELVANNHDDEALISSVQKMYAEAGREAEGAALVRESVDGAVALNNAGVQKARTGDLDGAIELLTTAAEQLPGNAQIVMNAAQSMIVHMLRNGLQQDKVDRVKGYIARIRRHNPEHPKFLQVNKLFQDMAQRMGNLRRMNAPAEHGIDLHVLLASNIHEIKNLVGELTLIMDQLVAEDEHAAAARFLARRVSDRMVQILTLYRMASERTTVSLSDHSPADFLEELAEEARVLARERVSIASCSDGAPGFWFFDRELVQAALLNALHNAMHYAREQVVLSVREADGFLVFTVEDDGGGFPAAVLEGQSRGFSGIPATGTGLGLYFADIIARAHTDAGRQGRLELANKADGRGTVFSLLLP